MKLGITLITSIFYSGVAFAQDITPRIDLLHHWRTDAEQHALHAIKDAVEEQGVIWTDAAAPGDINGLVQHFATMTRAGVPPGAVQWSNSDAAMQQIIKMGQFVYVDGLVDDFNSKLLPEVLDNITLDERTLVLPIGIHTYNFMVYNRSVMESIDAKPAESWSELIGYGDALQQQGIYLLSTSDQFWQLRTLFRPLIASEMSLPQFEKFMETDSDLDLDVVVPALTTAIEHLISLKRYTMPNTEDLNWEDASKRVAEGHAMIQILGDYILPNFTDRDNITCATTPQSQFMFWGMDSFALVDVKEPEVQAGQQALIKAIADPEVLKEYAYRKGGLPVISGVNPVDLDPCNAETQQTWNNSEKTFSGGYADNDRYLKLFNWMAAIWREDGDVDVGDWVGEFLAELEQN